MLNKTVLEYENKIVQFTRKVTGCTVKINAYETKIQDILNSKETDSEGLMTEIKTLRKNWIKAMSSSQQ